MAAFRSRIAGDIDASADAFLIGGQSRKTINLAPLGHLHSMSFTEADRNIGYFKDFRNTIADHIRSDIGSSSMVDIRSMIASSDEKLRDNQANVFIALVLDVRRSAVSSIELAAPALRALQMLLQSRWQPTAAFTHEFLEVIVSMLSYVDIGERSELVTGAASISAIAEDIISTILLRGPKNTDFLLDVLFRGLRSDTTFVFTSAQVSILSQALGAYLKTSIPNIIHRLIQKTKTLSKKELLWRNALNVDTAWRKSLNLGDDLVVLSGAGTTNWMIASIVKIDYRTDSLTLEYRPPGAFLPGDEPATLQLIEVLRCAGRIKPLTFIGDITAASAMCTSTSKSVDHDEIADSQSDLSEHKLSSPSNSSVELIYTVKRNHRLCVGILFDSMAVKDSSSEDREVRSQDRNNSHEDNNIDSSPRCMHLHRMAVTSLEKIMTHFYCSEDSLTCDCCGDFPSQHDNNAHRGWYCDYCRYHMCFSCHPEPPKYTLTIRLERSLDVIEPLQLFYHKFPRNSSREIFLDGNIIEVNTSFDNPNAAHCDHDISLNGFPSLHDGNFYRLTDGSGYVLKRPSGWIYNIVTEGLGCSNRSPSPIAFEHTVAPSGLPTLTHRDPLGTNSAVGCVMNLSSFGDQKKLSGFSHNKSDLGSDLYLSKQSSRSPVVLSAVQDYRISDLVEHIIVLDKIRKRDIIGLKHISKCPEYEDLTLKDDETSIKLKLLTCALSVFEKVCTSQL